MASDIGTLLDIIGYYSSTPKPYDIYRSTDFNLSSIIIIVTTYFALLLLLTLTPSFTIFCYFYLAMLLHAAVTPCSFVFELCFSIGLLGPRWPLPLSVDLHLTLLALYRLVVLSRSLLTPFSSSSLPSYILAFVCCHIVPSCIAIAIAILHWLTLRTMNPQTITVYVYIVLPILPTLHFLFDVD